MQSMNDENQSAVLAPLDGGVTVTSGIPAADDRAMAAAYASAPEFVESLAPAPAYVPAPEQTPDFEAGDELTENFVLKPRMS